MIDLDVLPPGRAVAAAVNWLLQITHGERAELRSGAALAPVWREMNKISPGGCGFTALEDGPPRWGTQVLRRDPAS